MSNRVGIVTLGGNFNYGNKLQNYAVQRIYQALGFETKTLTYGGLSPVSWARHTAAKMLYPAAEADPESVMGERRVRAFNEFSSRIETQAVGDSLSRLPDQYDYFSVGSDQVWNPRGIDSYKWMFLKFARPSQRIALAPSIGVSEIRSPYARHMMKAGLRGFSHLTVREEEGARLIKELTGQEATVVIDPTLMLDSDEWRKVSDDSDCPTEPYVFSYVLGKKTFELEKHIEELTNDGELSIVSLSDRSRSGEIDAGPAEFISLIDHAQHVVTDSYHAAVFSILMGTPLTIFRREGGSSSGMFSRLETLANKFDLWGCVFGDERFETEFVVGDTELRSSLLRERTIFSDCLAKSLCGVNISPIRGGVCSL